MKKLIKMIKKPNASVRYSIYKEEGKKKFRIEQWGKAAFPENVFFITKEMAIELLNYKDSKLPVFVLNEIIKIDQEA